jgi:hypothetical protein
VLSIYEENVCCHHASISLDFENVKGPDGRPVIAIISEVCPSGPQGGALERSLNNPQENVCFSIRAFTDDYRDGGITKRVLKTIVTWDYVNEPGIAVAEKFLSPALEDLAEKSFSRGEMERAVRQPAMAGMGMESVRLTAGELFTSMGWDIPTSKPSWAIW